MPVNSGLIIRPSRRDYISERVFGSTRAEATPHLGRLGEIKDSPLAKTPLYQGRVPSCVAAAASFLNMYNSLVNSANPVHLSWAFLYAAVKHYAGGTIPQDIFSALRKSGQAEDQKFPSRRFTDDPDMAETSHAPAVAFLGAERYRISSYLFHRRLSLPDLYPTLQETPLIIGVTVDPRTWSRDEALYTGQGFKHAVALVDAEPDGRAHVVSWDKPDSLDLRILAPGYPLELAVSFRDIPDYVEPRAIRRGITLDTIRSSLCRPA